MAPSSAPPFVPLSRCARASDTPASVVPSRLTSFTPEMPDWSSTGRSSVRARRSGVVENRVAPVEHRLAMAHADQVAHQLTRERRARGERRELGQFGVERGEVAAHGVQQVLRCFGLAA